MTPTHTRGVAATILAAVAMTACSSVRRDAVDASAPQPVSERAGLAAIARARADSARYPWTEADVHFMSAMIGHHGQAIAMAGLAPTHGASALVRILAERIINAQQDEIATMRHWLGDRQLPVPGANAAAMKMMNGSEHEMLMPGMLSAAQMDQLDKARNAEFDRLFLTFMIRHHRGSVSMVKELFESDGAAQDETVFKFASDANVDQTTEIARMERMLVALLTGNGAP